MRKEDIEVVARLLTEIKNSLDELESAMKKKNADKISAVKQKILDLQMQIGRKL
ncbi:MAG: hypothetical protein QXS38_02005 [Candidatus Pacearchaeota archaeon]